MQNLLVAILVSLLMLVSGMLAYALWPAPSADAVMKRNDERRVAHLNTIVEAAHDFYRARQRVPYSLEELSESRRGLQWHDPATGEPYEFQFIRQHVYSLCAVFETSTRDGNFGYLPGFNNHDAGHACVYRTFE